ncbi:WW domain binding protein 11 [Besnoitia besnoiti]|uniref:WW domain binding protein 11 n=1 Tax=Besnoitia besnoiti TaxID=94643 RepID=A0A2A9MCX0_BESBE|nr:WW domain binding protein 11 [Besnoitia besnoiti]PFH35719.1 WW domain binding protein 11 [Besnoitia besnoiti]
MRKIKVKSGSLKVVNPPDEYRKSQRDKEKRKNKMERRHNRELSILKRNPRLIKEELDQLCAIEKTNTLRDTQRKRKAKLEQLWEMAVRSVEAEKLAREAELQIDDPFGAGEEEPEEGSVQAQLSVREQRNLLNTGGRRGDRRKGGAAEHRDDDEFLSRIDTEQRRYYNPDLCNAGIFRHPDGSLRGYPPSVRSEGFDQRRKYIEGINVERRQRGEEASSGSSDEDSEQWSDVSDSEKSANASGSRLAAIEEKQESEPDDDDILASLPLPSEPPPAFATAGASGLQVLQPPASAAQPQAAPSSAPTFPPPMYFPFPGSAGANAGESAKPTPPFPFMPPPPPPFMGFAPPMPPPFMPTGAPGSSPYAPGAPAFSPPGPRSPFAQTPGGGSQPPAGSAAPPQAPPAATSSASPWSREATQAPREQRPGPYSPPEATKPALSKAAVAFVPTQLRTKNKPSPAPVVPPRASLEQVSAYSTNAGLARSNRWGAGALEGTAAGTGSRGTSVAALFAKNANPGAAAAAERAMTGAAASGGATGKAGEASKDLDELFNDFLREVGEK